MPFQLGDICISAPGWKAGCWVISGVQADSPGRYCGIHLVTGKHFHLKESGLVKVGQVCPGFNPASLIPHPKVSSLPAEEDEEYLLGKERAAYCSRVDRTEHRKRWELLARAKPGEWLGLWRDGNIERIKFHKVLTRGQKYVFVAEDAKGKVYRYPLEALVVEGEWQSPGSG